MEKIILATSSVHRQEAFRVLGLEYIAEASAVDERFEGRPGSPEDLVLALAELKAEAVARNHARGIVIGFDSVGWYDGKILEKPATREEACSRLQSLSGGVHEFYTGIYMKDLESRKSLSKVVRTDVYMRCISDSEILKYLDQDPRFNTYALGYDPLGNYSSTFVKNIRGSYNNLTRGIPLETVVEMLAEVGYKL